MYFLAILITFFLLQRLGSFHAFQRDEWFFGLLGAGSKLFHNPLLVYVFSLGVPTLALVAILLVFHDRWYGVVSLLLAIAALVYSLGRIDYNAAAGEYMQFWRNADYEAMPRILETLGDASFALDEGLEVTHVKVRDAYVHAAFQGLFAVLFWFVLLGPAAALFYRLNTCFVSNSDWPVARRVQSVIDWPASCLASLTFVLMGNYDQGMPQWLATVFNRGMSNRQVVHANALAATGLGMNWLTVAFSRENDLAAQSRLAVEEMQVLTQLVRRSLVFLVFVVAIFQIVI